MKPHHTSDIEIILPRAALDVVFDECDLYDHDETGGRLVGSYKETDGKLMISVQGIIEPGPKARRSPVMLFQDGEYQEKAFRRIESQNPHIEHLGTWHTHHMNGLQTLSGGDINTYTRTVNHPNQNTNFFYALLVVNKHIGSSAKERYSYKHFVFRRDDDRFYEISPRYVKIVDSPLLWPRQDAAILPPYSNEASIIPERPTGPGMSQYARRIYEGEVQIDKPNLERAYDKEIISEFYKHVKPFNSPKLGIYWRGPIELVDGSDLEVVLLEDSSKDNLTYSLVLRNAPAPLNDLAERLRNQEFSSARAALVSAERVCNRILFERSNHQPR